MCTGRSKAENPPELWSVGFGGMIGGNGSYVEVEGEVVMHQTLTAGQCRRIVDWCHARGHEFYLETNDGLFVSERFREASGPVLRAYARSRGTEAPEGAKTELHGSVYGGELYRDDVNKVSFILSDYQDYLDAREAFADMRVGTWGGRGEKALFADVGLADVDKARAVRMVAEHLGVRISDTRAMGDAKVDVPMLEACGVGVAMGSGGEEIRAMADYVTTDVDKDGLCHAFRHLGLIEDPLLEN